MCARVAQFSRVVNLPGSLTRSPLSNGGGEVRERVTERQQRARSASATLRIAQPGYCAAQFAAELGQKNVQLT